MIIHLLMIAVTVSSALGKLLHQSEDLHKPPHKKKYHALLQWLESHRSKLVATFPGIEDEMMQVHFMLRSDENITDSMLEEFRRLPGVEAAYRKPEDSLP